MKPALLLLLAALFSIHQETSRIEGIVTRSDGTTPVPGVRVILRKDQSVRAESDYGTLTGSDGRFILKDVSAGRYRLLARKPGFIDAEYGQKQPSRPGTVLDLSTAQALKDLTVKMTAGSVISGRVYDHEGQALSNVQVQLIRPRYIASGHMTAIAVSSATTNDLGEYRIYWVAPGTYYLTATVFERNPQLETALNEQYTGPETVFIPTFYPNAPDDAHATPIKVEPGSELRAIDFTMTRLRGVRVLGQVVDGLTGQPVAGARITIRLKTEGWANMASISSVLTDTNGQFEARRVAPGTNSVVVLMTLPGARQVSSRTDVAVGERDIVDYRVVLQPTPSISGRVIFEDGGSHAGLLHFASLDSATGYGAPIPPDGAFKMPAIPPGIYRPALNFSDATFFIRSARISSRNVLRDGIDVTSNSADNVEIVIAAKAGLIQGTVTDERNVASVGAQLALIPIAERRERPDLFKSAASDQFGRFTIRGITPGDYKLFAWTDIEPYAFFDPAFVQPYETQGTPIHIDDAGSVTINLKVLP